jgi:hypothetical protein
MNVRPLGARVVTAILLAMCACCVSNLARAEYRQRVVVLDTSAEDRAAMELLTRLRGELAAAGFDVISLPASSPEDPRATVETAGGEIGPAAVVLAQESFDTELGERVAKLWVSDRISRRTLMQSMTLNPREQGRDRALLAVQVAELLKARFAALTVSEEPSGPVPQVKPRQSVGSQNTALPERSVSTSVSAGLGILRSFEHAGSSWAPVIRVGLLLPELSELALALELRGSGAITATELELQAKPGSAHVSQGFAGLDVVLHVGPRWPLQPLLSLGAGAYSVTAEGRAQPEFTRRTLRSWSISSSVGAGLWAQPSRHFAWTLEAQMMAAWSRTQIEIDDARVEEFGAPMLFLSTALVGVL